MKFISALLFGLNLNETVILERMKPYDVESVMCQKRFCSILIPVIHIPKACKTLEELTLEFGVDYDCDAEDEIYLNV